ncbi:ABC transporter permease [Ruminococcus sp.]|uniref:ABC transporter permease n=1 Tax=Ruminococcus sp. TaxID=41978 RepID=UPI003994168A
MLENIRLSIQGIFAHKIRSILTMLGIIIGIAAIIAIVSTIRGTNEQIKSNLVGAGNRTVTVPSIRENMSWICSIKDFRPVFR